MTTKERTAITSAIRSTKPCRPDVELSKRDLSNWVGAEKQWQTDVSAIASALAKLPGFNAVAFADSCYGIDVAS